MAVHADVQSGADRAIGDEVELGADGFLEPPAAMPCTPLWMCTKPSASSVERALPLSPGQAGPGMYAQSSLLPSLPAS